MTRRLAERQPRRLLRMRSPTARPDHATDLALVSLGDQAAPQADTSHGANQRALRALRALAEENALLARELGRVQARCTRWRDDCIAQAQRLEALLMRARAEVIAKETQLAAIREALAALQQRAAGCLASEALVRRITDLRARNRTREVALADARRTPAIVEPAPQAQPAAPDTRRVLCVGGRARQIPAYRQLVEQRGGRFLHVDGSAANCLPALHRLLADADVVILQPAFVCQGAWRAVETHCARQGLRCIPVDSTCALAFAQALEAA